jgi:hypothetical protein
MPPKKRKARETDDDDEEYVPTRQAPTRQVNNRRGPTPTPSSAASSGGSTLSIGPASAVPGSSFYLKSSKSLADIPAESILDEENAQILDLSKSLTLKSDHEKRPIWVTTNNLIILVSLTSRWLLHRITKLFSPGGVFEALRTSVRFFNQHRRTHCKADVFSHLPTHGGQLVFRYGGDSGLVQLFSGY